MAKSGSCHKAACSFPLTGDDKRLMTYAYLLPGAGILVGVAACKATGGLQYFQACKKPEWAPQCPKVYGALHLVAASPLGCAAMLAYKHGGGCENKTVAYGLTGFTASVGLSALALPLLSTKKCTKCATAAAATAALAGAATVALFAKIDRHPALMMVPWTALHIFYSLVLAKTQTP